MHKVSVIMPFKDGHEFIHDALNSIEQQVGFEVEVIIADDHSVSPICIDFNKYSFAIKTILNPDPKVSGAGYARGRAISAATGRFVAFLDCDDLWAPGKLASQISQMTIHDWAFSVGGYCPMSESQRVLKALAPYIPNGSFNWNGFLAKRFTIGCLTVIYDRMLLKDPLPSHLKRRNDYHMWAQLLRQADDKQLAWGAVDEVIGFHRVRKGSLSSSKIKAIWGYWVFLGVVEPNVFRRILFYVQYLLNTIFLRVTHG